MQCLLRKTTIKVVLFTVSLFNLLFLSLCLMNPNVMAGWKSETIIDPDDPGGLNHTVGYGTSLAFNSSGNPAISFLHTDENCNDSVMFARSTDGGVTWLSGNITTVVTEGMGDHTSFTFDPSGNPGIAFVNDWPISRLKYAYSTDGGITWLPGNITTVAVEDTDSPPLGFDGSGNPAISYDTDEGIKYANRVGSTWIIEVVDPDECEALSLAFDGSGNPAIAYAVDEVGLKYAHRAGGTWNIETVDTGICAGSDYVSLAFNGSGNPGISYYKDEGNGKLKYAHRAGGTWNTETVDTEGDVGWYTSLAFDASGNPAISYYDFTNGDLKYAHRVSGTWNIETVDSEGNVGGDTSLAFDSSGNPAISYYDLGNHRLKYAYFRSNICSCADDSIPPAGCVSGRVTNLAGQPLANKTVRLRKVHPTPSVTKTAVTDNNGCYGAADLVDGSYSVQAIGCRGGGVKAVVVCGQKVTDVDFKCR